jgi:DNA-binding response OmpR family regulator
MSAKLPELLIIDDRMESIALLLRYFHGQAFSVMVALNGKDGIRKAISAPPVLILLDVTMPQMDGFEVCRQLKVHPQTAHIPVVFLSAQHDLAQKLQGFAAGAVDYIEKPFSLDEVMARVHVHAKLPLRLSASHASVDCQPASAHAHAHESQESRESRVMAAALDLLHDPLYPWQGVDALASRVGVIEKRLTELFRQHFGMSVSAFHINRRLELARTKLTPGGPQIQRIAEEAGYQNASDFSRAFRQRYGLGPRQYRDGTRKAGVDPAPMAPP